MSCNLKYFSLATPMLQPEQMKINIQFFRKILLKNITIYIYQKGMYGLKQAAILDYDNLVKNLQPYGQKNITHTPVLWKNETKPITFCLCVEDVGIKYSNKSDVNHLLQSSKIITLKRLIGKGGDYVVSHYIDNTTRDMMKFQRQVMNKKYFKSSSTNHQNHPNFHH